MIVRKILVGEGAGKYLPYALARLRALVRAFPKGHATQRFEIEGAFITIQQSGRFKAIWIFSGQLYFEFQTSGFPIITQDMVISGIPLTAYKMGVIGVGTKSGSLVPKLMGGKRSVTAGAEFSRIYRWNQVQVLDEQCHIYNTKEKDYSRQVYESWAAKGGHSGIYFTAYHTAMQIITVHTSLPSATTHFIRDVGIDEEWADGKGTAKRRMATINDGPADWPRRSGIQLVTDAVHGTREFAICFDAFDQANVFSTSVIGELDTTGSSIPQNVDQTKIKVVRVTFPSWAYKKTTKFKDSFAASGNTDTGLYTFPEIDWNFSPDGTKICAIVYAREEAVFNSSFFAPYATDTSTKGKATFFPDATSFDKMNAATAGVAAEHGGGLATGTTYYMSAPGLLEVQIKITLTGANEEDFTVELITTEVRSPYTSPYCTMCVGYAGQDLKVDDFDPDNPQYKARRGDLCTLDVECYGNLTTNKAATLWSLKNITQSKEIRTFGVASSFTTGVTLSGIINLVSFDMRTLSFVFKYRQDQRFTSPSTALTPFMLGVFIQTKHKHNFFPDQLGETDREYFATRIDRDDRVAMTTELGSLSLMPLNDLSDWTSDMLLRLRQWYCQVSHASAFNYGPYAGNPQPYANPDISDEGYCFFDDATPTIPSPTTEHFNWYNNIVRHGTLKPYIIFYLVNPMPGWWQYMGQCMRGMDHTGHITFYTHPNGSWAFFCQNYIHNGNKVPLTRFSTPGAGTSGWDVTKMEHCIFDRVQLIAGSGAKSTTLTTTFVELYNKAIQNGIEDETLTDDTAVVTIPQLRATWTLGTIVDPLNSAVSYAQMQVTWPPGYSAYYREMGHFSGTIVYGVDDFDPRPIGMSLDLSFGALWKQTPANGSVLIYPDQEHMPFTCSTCVLITGA